jgi:hydroxymethylpyrimidine pyrophosphatase-like HAD family hydrolase/predicted DCC family thiol-disulfide oxidoreductase YuxK
MNQNSRAHDPKAPAASQIHSQTHSKVAKASTRPAAVATDCDGTLTTDGTLTPSVLAAIGLLRDQQIPLVLVTGRAAGYAWTLFELVNAQAVIAENGGMLYERSHPEQPIWLNPVGQNENLKPGGWQRGHELFAELKQAKLLPVDWPLTHDCSFRFTDFTFPLESDGVVLSQEQLSEISKYVGSKGASFVYSTIHAHIMPHNQTKARMLSHWAERNGIKEREILTIGDSLNDESLFEEDKFGASWGVANIRTYLPAMTYRPQNTTRHSQGWGFAEMVCSLAETKLSERESPLGKFLCLDLGYSAVLFIDGYCSLCTSIGKRLQRILLHKPAPHELRLSTLQSNTAQKLLGASLRQSAASTPPSVILWHDDKTVDGAAAIIRLFDMLGGGYSLVSRILRLFPAAIINLGYTLIANNRYKIFGRRAECSLIDRSNNAKTAAGNSAKIILD